MLPTRNTQKWVLLLLVHTVDVRAARIWRIVRRYYQTIGRYDRYSTVTRPLRPLLSGETDRPAPTPQTAEIHHRCAPPFSSTPCGWTSTTETLKFGRFHFRNAYTGCSDDNSPCSVCTFPTDMTGSGPVVGWEGALVEVDNVGVKCFF